MLSRSLAVLGILAALTFADPAGAMGFYGEVGWGDSPRAWSHLDLGFAHSRTSWAAPSLGTGLNPWSAPSPWDPEHVFSGSSFGGGQHHGFTWSQHSSWNDSRRHWHSSWRCDQRRPGTPVPEPGAALLFGIGALVVRRRLQRR